MWHGSIGEQYLDAAYARHICYFLDRSIAVNILSHVVDLIPPYRDVSKSIYGVPKLLCEMVSMDSKPCRLESNQKRPTTKVKKNMKKFSGFHKYASSLNSCGLPSQAISCDTSIF